jgi:hypothetical protein
MARFAAVDAYRGVLEYERSAFLYVAAQTSLFIKRFLRDHVRPIGHAPCRSKRAVRVVAIAALHESFIDAMLEGHRELRLNGWMAGVAQPWLRPSE